MKITAPQRVEKGVDLEMQTILHAEETSRNRAEFLFFASGCRTTVLPPSKRRKAQMPHKHLVYAAFNYFQRSINSTGKIIFLLSAI